MKTKHFLTLGILSIALTGAIFTGCKKDSNTSTDADVSAAQDESNASFVLQDSKSISDGAEQNQATERMEGGGPCATYRRIVDTTYNSQVDSAIEISFPGSCISPDGRTRSGDIFVFWNGGRYFDSGSVITMTFRNYSVKLLNGFTVGVTGTRVLTNAGKDSAGDQSWNFTANLSLVYSNGGGTATWNSTRTNVLQKIGGVWYYEINGSASGVTRKGVNYNIEITNTLYHTAWWINAPANRCDCFESGEVAITRTGHTYPLDLTFTSGIGNCNHTATATINGNNYNITLP
jgi:hypothetical protein